MQSTVNPYAHLTGHSVRDFEAFGRDYLPGLLGVELLSADPSRVTGRVPVRQELLGPHGYLHGGVLVSIADTLCGYGTIAALPEGASGFLTIELKTNFFGAMRAGTVLASATPLHLGRSTQVWDATVSDERDGRRLALFRCTQLVLWDRASGHDGSPAPRAPLPPRDSYRFKAAIDG